MSQKSYYADEASILIKGWEQERPEGLIPELFWHISNVP